MMESIYPAKETTNGAHRNTVIITAKFPVSIYYPIKNNQEVFINEYDFEKVKRIIEKLYKKVNIVVDSRLNYIALAIALSYPDYCLVFDIEDSTVKNIYQHLSSHTVLDLRGLYLYTVNGKKLIDLYMFIKHFCTNLSIIWNTEKAVDICDRNNNFVDIVLNYIGIHEYNQNDKIADVIKNINDIVRSNFSNRVLVFEDKDSLYSALVAMKAIENTVKVYY